MTSPKVREENYTTISFYRCFAGGNLEKTVSYLTIVTPGKGRRVRRAGQGPGRGIAAFPMHKR